MLLNGFRDEAWKEELWTIDRRRGELEATIAAAATDPPLPALHPAGTTVFEQKSRNWRRHWANPDIKERARRRDRR